MDRAARRRQPGPHPGHQRWAARCFARLRRSAGARGLHRAWTIRCSRTPSASPNCTPHGYCPSRSARHGLDVDALAWRLRSGQRIKALYTVPDFHNPSGGVLPGRRSGTGWSSSPSEYGFVIVSDNPYREYGFSGPAGRPTSQPIPIRSSGSAPSPRPWARGFGSAGSSPRPGWHRIWRTSGGASDFHSSVLGQRLITELLTRPGWFDWLARRPAGPSTPQRAAILGDALREPAWRCPRTSRTRRAASSCGPRSSTPPSIPPISLARRPPRGLLLTAGRNFAATGGSSWDRRLRLAYSSPPIDHLAAGRRPPGRRRRRCSADHRTPGSRSPHRDRFPPLHPLHQKGLR